MRKLYTVAFPTLGEEDARFIGAVRARHDRQASILGPHFTLLFGCDALDEATYVDHVRTIAASTAAFAFTCFETEAEGDARRGVVYLVPDLGRGEVTSLHDRLYAGPMAPYLRQDAHFVAHMTIGHADDVDAAARLCDALNADGINVAGAVDALVVGCVEHARFVELARFALRH